LSASTPAVELRLPSRLGFEKVAMSTAASLASLMGFEPDRIEDLKTAISEACINAMEHGNHFNNLLLVFLTFTMEGDTLEVRVRDCGSGVKDGNPHVPDMERKLRGEEEARGMGMFLIKSLVDEAEWVSNGPEDSYTRLVIHLPAVLQGESGTL
jgi:serine/threonine-protein kinase RsbW